MRCLVHDMNFSTFHFIGAWINDWRKMWHKLEMQK